MSYRLHGAYENHVIQEGEARMTAATGFTSLIPNTFVSVLK